MKYYYLINGKIMSANEKMPSHISLFANWHSSLQPCEISESELEKVIKHYLQDCSMSSNPIEVTDIVELEWNKKYAVYELFFKQPKQVEEIEAVDQHGAFAQMYKKAQNMDIFEFIVMFSEKYQIFKNQK